MVLMAYGEPLNKRTIKSNVMPNIKLNPVQKARIEIEVRDKDGKLIEQRTEELHTWVRNYYKALFQFYGGVLASGERLRNVNGDLFNFTFYDGVHAWSMCNPFDYTAPAGVDTYGIQVGTDNTAYDIDQYCLVTKILTGTSSGKLDYGASQITGYGNPYKLIRTFTNGSLASIIVKEIGVISHHLWQVTDSYWLQCRDVPISPITVPIGSTLTVRYVLSW